MSVDKGHDTALTLKSSGFGNILANLSVSVNKSSKAQVAVFLGHIALDLHHPGDGYPPQSDGGPMRKSKKDTSKVCPYPWTWARLVAMSGGNDKGNLRKLFRAAQIGSPNNGWAIGKPTRTKNAMRTVVWLLQGNDRCIATDAGAAFFKSLKVDPDKVD